MADQKKQRNEQNIITPPGIVSFPRVWTPKAFEPGKEPEYGLILVFDPDADLTPLKKAIKAAVVSKFGADYKEKGIKLRNPIRPASDYASYGEPFDVDGRVFINAKTRTAPGIVDRRAQPILNQSEFYAGCLARASVYCHPYDTKGNKGVTLLLNNIQKTGDGKQIAGRMSAEHEFERLDPTDGAEDDDIL